MIHPDTFLFLSELKENNHKTWFDAHQPRYQAVRKGLIAFMEILIEKVSAFDESVMGIQPSKTIFRINRDIRFSQDKSPYKNNMGAHLVTKSSHGVGLPGYYLHLQPQECFLGGGVYMPDPNMLKLVREKIDREGARLADIVTQPDFIQCFGELKGGRLKSAPKGFEKEHPYLSFIQMKDFYVGHALTEADVFSPHFADHCAKVFHAMYPLNTFLREAATAE